MILPPHNNYKDDWDVYLIIGAVVLFICIIIYMFYGLHRDLEENIAKAEANTPSPNLQIGDVVRVKIGNTKGMIIDINCYSYHETCSYDVRLHRETAKTNTHLLRDDDNIETSQYSITTFEEFEISKEE